MLPVDEGGDVCPAPVANLNGGARRGGIGGSVDGAILIDDCRLPHAAALTVKIEGVEGMTGTCPGPGFESRAITWMGGVVGEAVT
jgi:hypothetical protein